MVGSTGRQKIRVNWLVGRKISGNVQLLSRAGRPVKRVSWLAGPVDGWKGQLVGRPGEKGSVGKWKESI